MKQEAEDGAASLLEAGAPREDNDERQQCVDVHKVIVRGGGGGAPLWAVHGGEVCEGVEGACLARTAKLGQHCAHAHVLVLDAVKACPLTVGHRALWGVDVTGDGVDDTHRQLLEPRPLEGVKTHRLRDTTDG